MGPPGAGKGTQAARVSAALGVPTISTGDSIRAQIHAGTALGLEAKRYSEAGELIPEALINGMVADRLSQLDVQNGFLLDGYPRTTAQVDELDRLLTEQGVALDRAVELVADTDEVVRRLLHRATVEGRADDTEDVIRHRLHVYAEETQPLSAVYAERGLLVQVDGMGEVDDVTARIFEAIGFTADAEGSGFFPDEDGDPRRTTVSV
jgi:adenylate kinase